MGAVTAPESPVGRKKMLQEPQSEAARTTMSTARRRSRSGLALLTRPAGWGAKAGASGLPSFSAASRRASVRSSSTGPSWISASYTSAKACRIFGITSATVGTAARSAPACGSACGSPLSSSSIEVTLLFSMPQGTMSPKWESSVVTFSARPCMVIQRLMRTPTAPIFRSPRSPERSHTPSSPFSSMRVAERPYWATVRIITSSRFRT
jgi:hypothetical protein